MAFVDGFFIGFAIIILVLGIIELFDPHGSPGLGLLAMVLSAGLFVIAMASADSAYDKKQEETIKICTQKGGQVNDDGLCIVGDKPVEYSKGQWIR